MNIGAILVGFALLIGGGAYIARPLFERSSGKRQWQTGNANPQTGLVKRRDAIYALIRELDADHQTGKTNDEDYQTLRERHVADGIAILKQLDDLKDASNRTALEAEIEARVQALRQAPAAPRSIDRSEPTRFCSQCGHPTDPEDRFCAHCGAALRGAATQ
jgi:NADH pyrophosphatase NudC (nudix superfamily)